MQVLVALGGGCVVYLVVGQGSLTEVRTEQMGHEVSCMVSCVYCPWAASLHIAWFALHDLHAAVWPGHLPWQ